ncbi:MAG: hypothetical protein AAGJ81_03145 [Verrucomicrobiota bacterium]
MGKNKASAGIVSLLAAAGHGAQAHIIQSPTVGSGLMPPAFGDELLWSVDGDGDGEFALYRVDDNAIFAGALTGANFSGRGSVIGRAALPFAAYALPPGFSIGATLATGYAFKQESSTGPVVFTVNSAIFVYAESAGFSIGQSSLIGFRFDISGNTHYGWLRLEPTAGPVGRGITISEAYYESTPDTPIAAGAIPEPANAAVGLGLLALGAAGLRRWRRDR